MNDINVECLEGLEFLKTVESNTVDLILTDPPYITSRDSGMDKWKKHVARQDASGSVNMKTEKDWNEYSTKRDWDKFFEGHENQKQDLKPLRANYLKYGSIYGKKYALETDHGEWDNDFTMEALGAFVQEFYRVLRPGGTCIIFFDLWKITGLKDLLEGAGGWAKRPVPKNPRKATDTKPAERDEDFLARKEEVERNPLKLLGFSQLRLVEWVKTNPAPVNSQRNYLTNCREIALAAVKGGNGTFNSSYDNGIYRYPIYAGKDRFHPTQKSLNLFEDLINKHSHEGDLVVDCFLGSGTTALAARHTNRKFSGCELDEEYYNKTMNRLKERAL